MKAPPPSTKLQNQKEERGDNERRQKVSIKKEKSPHTYDKPSSRVFSIDKRTRLQTKNILKL